MNVLNSQFTTNGANTVGIFPSGTTTSRVSVASSTLTAANRPFLTEVLDSATLNLQLLSSTFSNATNPVAVEVSGAGNASICLDATGNTFNSGLELDQSGASTTLGVEEDSNLSALNNSATITRTGTIGDLMNGACGF
ncbi:MAG TPA: hypothetical protein EYO33_23835 [Phycisphaerales bacterium]|nr:hypothetical protein [Phycisphaerales bacterium]